MNIFKEIKEYLTALQAAEQYGIKINRNKMACCPFHDDHHPSMKIDQNYYCFACGAKGDVIDFTSKTIRNIPVRGGTEADHRFWTADQV